jgi:1,4-alpha-glucan branching enzyme
MERTATPCDTSFSSIDGACLSAILAPRWHVFIVDIKPRMATRHNTQERAMSTKKQYLKNKPYCKVTFRLTKEFAGNGKKAGLAGEFNDWQAEKTPMKALKNGDFTVTVNLATGREYQYRFVVDGAHWITDTQADKYVHAGIANTQNGVVVV